MTSTRMFPAAALTDFPRQRTWLLPALDSVQRSAGWVSPEALSEIAAHLRVPLSEVWGVATGYPEIRLTAPGRRLVRVCTGPSCSARGGRRLLAECEARLGVRAGATTADGGVTLEEVDCAFACGVAPVVEVAHRRHGRVSVSDLGRVLESPSRMAGAAIGEAGAPAPPPSGGGASIAERLAALQREAARGVATTTRLVVGLGSCAESVGARETIEALRAGIERRSLGIHLTAGGCNGTCWAAPVVEVLRPDGERLTLGPVTAPEVPRLLDALAGARPPGDLQVDEGWLAPQRRVLLDRCGVVDATDIGDAIRRGSYGALARALAEGRPEHLIDEVRAAGLLGRGGAYFPTAVKWAGCRQASGAPKYVVVNGEEGEPGIFKDRHLMEGDPHRLLEGTLLAAFAVGASHAILYVHGEADLAAERLRVAVAQARAWGLVGQSILGSDFSLDLQIRRGLGGFVLGEETALLESIEGRRAMPRTRPPFPVEAGLWGKPTVIDNVETLCAVPGIVERGGAWFAAMGRGHGTKLFGLSGHLRRPGVVEVEMGASLRTLLDALGGGTETGGPVVAAVVGGPSGVVVPASRLDEPLVPRGTVNPGTGSVIALAGADSVREVVRALLAFNARESCGKCTPCREGTARLLALLEAPLDVGTVSRLAEVIQLASLCGLGQAAPLSVLSGLADFPEAFGRVPARTV